MNRFTFLLVLLVLAGRCSSEPDTEDRTPTSAMTTLAGAEYETTAQNTAQPLLFKQTMDYAQAQRLHEQKIGEIMQALGVRFTSSPYIAGSLDEAEEETLVCRLDGFDCVTFVETMIAMARGISKEDYSYDTFLHHIRDQRYRGGQMNGYCSRLHYFTEWILDNTLRGTIENISESLGGERLDKQIRFMGEHRDSYPRLVGNDSLFSCILDMEHNLENIKLHYIPQDRIRAVYSHLRAGDIIATATRIEGLDVTHTGLVYHPGDGTRGFLHASTSEGVTVSPDLQSYIQSNAVQIGIIVARPVETRF